MKISTPTGWLRIALLAAFLVALGWALRGSVPVQPAKGGGGELRVVLRAQEILARDLPIAPLAEAVLLAIYRAGVHGLPQVEARGLVPVHDYSLVRVEPAKEREAR